MNLIDKKIAFLGDSITEGAGVSKIENVFWKRVAERTGAKAYGYGVGGTRIAPQHNPDSNAPSVGADMVMRLGDMDDTSVLSAGTRPLLPLVP